MTRKTTPAEGAAIIERTLQNMAESLTDSALCDRLLTLVQDIHARRHSYTTHERAALLTEAAARLIGMGRGQTA